MVTEILASVTMKRQERIMWEGSMKRKGKKEVPYSEGLDRVMRGKTAKYDYIFIILVLLGYVNADFFLLAMNLLGLTGTICGGESTYRTTYDLYPKEEFQKPERFKKFFCYAEAVPKEVLQSVYVNVYGSIIFTAVLILDGLAWKSRYAGQLLFVMFTPVIYTLSCDCKAYYHCFRRRFKRMNRYNFKYFLSYLFMGHSTKWPLSANLGLCKAAEIRKRRKYQELTVEMKESDERIRKVWASKNMDIEEGREYCLYEICHVKYVF